MFTGFVVGDVLFFRETSDLFIGLVLIVYALGSKLTVLQDVASIEVSMVSITFMYISFLLYQHNLTTERFAVWTVIFLLLSLATQCMKFIKHRKRGFHKSI